MLEQQHKLERDSRVCDRIKAVLLSSEGWTQKQIAQALRIHETTVQTHLSDYVLREKLKPGSGGSSGKLDKVQTGELIRHLEQNVYPSTKEIIAYVFSQYKVGYTQQGMHDWLSRNKFAYKKPKGIPAKADEQKQAAFIDKYTELKSNLKADEIIVFMDSVHPTQETKISYGWIRVGVEKQIATVASGNRINMTGAIELSGMSVVTREYEIINGKSTIDFLQAVELAYPHANKIHVIADRGCAHTCHEVNLFLSEANAVNRAYLENTYGIMLPGNTIKLSIKLRKKLKEIAAKEISLFSDIGILDISDLNARELLNSLKAPPPHPKLVMHLLPAYSPNLNPIERMWRVMNEQVRNNKVFYKLAEFRGKISEFFNTTWDNILPLLHSRINDNFQVLKPAL